MSRINVVVAVTSPDVKAQIILESVRARRDMSLLDPRILTVSQVDALLDSIPRFPRCVLVVVGHPTDTNEVAARWMAKRADIALMHVDVIGDVVRIAVRSLTVDPLLTALRQLLERAVGRATGQVVPIGSPRPSLMDASIDWVHQVFRDAVEKVPDQNGDAHGLSVTRTTLLQFLAAPAQRDANSRPSFLTDADAALDRALAAAQPNDGPLAGAAMVFDLTTLEFRMMVLALSPELDPRYQLCIGFLLEEISRRAGTPAFYSALLGTPTSVRGELAEGGALTRWLVFDGQPAGDEPLKVDLFLAQWLLGDGDALANEPRVRRAMRLGAWPGVKLLQRDEERVDALALIDKLRNTSRWVLLGGDDPTGWRALVDLGAESREVVPLRIELQRLAGAELMEVEDCARRIARMTRLTGQPLIVDATRSDGSEVEDDWMRLFLATLDGMNCPAGVICRDPARIIRLLGSAPFELAAGPALSPTARVAALRTAAANSEAYLTDDTATALASRYPLGVDGLEQAMRLAVSRSRKYGEEDAALARFTAACRDVAVEGVSNLADRIDPVFDLDEVVLPPDRKQQLMEVVDHVRFAPQVLDAWKFREQLPYGRGVAALFHGPSGTGKTMAATGIARRLGIELLRLDFSRVVSKYIGDTEKNIDRIFTDAERSGAAILIDEADALLGKRSEVKDAHDRYANIEVAYLLQRMEAFEGLAILTTNMRQNLDPAFLRRLRFVVDFPRPDVEARRTIWRQCLPAESHELDDAAFVLLARKIDLSGGYIRQITLRAAFIAAAAGAQINLTHLAQAARGELAKLGMPPVDLDLGRPRRVA